MATKILVSNKWNNIYWWYFLYFIKDDDIFYFNWKSSFLLKHGTISPHAGERSSDSGARLWVPGGLRKGPWGGRLVWQRRRQLGTAIEKGWVRYRGWLEDGSRRESVCVREIEVRGRKSIVLVCRRLDYNGYCLSTEKNKKIRHLISSSCLWRIQTPTICKI